MSIQLKEELIEEILIKTETSDTSEEFIIENTLSSNGWDDHYKNIDRTATRVETLDNENVKQMYFNSIKKDKKMPKNRGHNYTEREKFELLQIIDKYKEIIENKKTDGAVIRAKQDCWKKITLEYNSINERHREVEHLKSCYSNIKRFKKSNSTKLVDEESLLNQTDENYEQNEINIQNSVIPQNINETNKEAYTNKIEDKQDLIQAGGDNFKERLADFGALVLAMCEDQLQPLINQYENAAAYFKDNKKLQNSSHIEKDDNPLADDEPTAGSSKILNNPLNIKKRSTLEENLEKYTKQRKINIEYKQDLVKILNEKKLFLLNLEINNKTLEYEQQKLFRAQEHEKRIKLLELEIYDKIEKQKREKMLWDLEIKIKERELKNLSSK